MPIYSNLLLRLLLIVASASWRQFCAGNEPRAFGREKAKASQRYNSTALHSKHGRAIVSMDVGVVCARYFSMIFVWACACKAEYSTLFIVCGTINITP